MITKQDAINFKFDKQNLGVFLTKIKDLVKIDTRLVLKMDDKNMLIFSFVGETFKNIHAFKNYLFDINEIIDIKKGSISDDKKLIFIIKDGKRFNRTLENFIDFDNDINCKAFFDEDGYISNITFNNNKLNIKIIGGDPITIGKDINVEDINYLMDVDKSLFNFVIQKNDFEKIRKMSLIDKQLKDVLNLYIKDKKIYIGETKWHLNIMDNVDKDNTTLTFPKDYFISMNPTNDIMGYVFDGFLLFKYDDYNLMIVLETN